MGTTVINKHGINIRRIALGFDRGTGYEVYTYHSSTRLTAAEMKEVALDLIKHLLEAPGR